MTTPILTRQAIFKHILTNILEVAVDEEIWTLVIVVEKCRSITDFIMLDRADFEQSFPMQRPVARRPQPSCRGRK
jgi:hypothetical protein